MIPTSWCNSQGLQSMECDGSASVTNGAGVNNSRNLLMPSPNQEYKISLSKFQPLLPTYDCQTFGKVAAEGRAVAPGGCKELLKQTINQFFQIWLFCVWQTLFNIFQLSKAQVKHILDIKIGYHHILTQYSPNLFNTSNDSVNKANII